MHNVLMTIFKDPSPELARAFDGFAQANREYQNRYGGLSTSKIALDNLLHEAQDAEASLKNATVRKADLLTAVVLGQATREDFEAAAQAEKDELHRSGDMTATINATRCAIPRQEREVAQAAYRSAAAYRQVCGLMYEQLRAEIVPPDLPKAIGILSRLKARASQSAVVPKDFFERLFEIRPDPTSAIDEGIEVFITEQLLLLAAPADRAGEQANIKKGGKEAI